MIAVFPVVEGPLLPLVALGWPLLIGGLAGLPILRVGAIRLLPFAPLPALWLGLRGVGEPTLAPDLLLGVVLDIGDAGGLLLSMTAALWLAAGLYAQCYMAGTARPAVFTGFWCLTLAGNLGVFLAGDVITFYVSFAAVSLSAFFLIVHDRTERAIAAGRLYIVLAVLGEACLLIAFIIAIAAAGGSLLITDIRAALPSAPLGGLAVILMVASFGLKAGLMPLHIWLPRAHPVAPTPASAVLSGAIVKAGVIGMIMFLPGGSWIGSVLMALGIFTGFSGALLGLREEEPKTILAYSTISQLGLVVALIGAAVMAGEPALQAVYYAFHHGLAKGALFLSVGVVAAAGGRWRILALVCVALVALSVAGAPLTGGALVKAAAKPGLPNWAALALTLSAVTTTLILASFIYQLWQKDGASDAARPALLMTLPTLLLGGAAMVLPWFLWPEWSGLPADYPLIGDPLWAATWPLALGLGGMGLAAWRGLLAPGRKG